MTTRYVVHDSGLWIPDPSPPPPPPSPPETCVFCGSENLETTTMGWLGEHDPNRKTCWDCGKCYQRDRDTGELVELERLR